MPLSRLTVPEREVEWALRHMAELEEKLRAENTPDLRTLK